MPRTTITLTTAPGGYRITVAGRFGGGYDRQIKGDAAAAAGILRQEIGRYLDTNPEGGDYHAPPEVLTALESGTIDAGPGKGARISYYASPAALVAIQTTRETTGDSQSGAINNLVLRGAAIKE